MADLELRLRYIGACALLGRIAKHVPVGDPDRFPIEMALKDCAELTGMKLVKSSGNTWSLEPSNG